MCAKREDLLRIQFDDERFSVEDEAALAHLSLDDPDQAFERYLYIMGLWHAWEHGYGKPGAGALDAETVRWQILSREPVRIRIARRNVDITSRGRAAMIRLQRHELRRTWCGEKLDLIERHIADTEARRREGEIGWWRALGRRNRLAALRHRVETEWEHHFRGILANAVTPDGRAALPEEAPDWWDQVTAEDETLILLALLEAGPGRMARGARPKKPDAKQESDEPMTFGSLLRAYEAKLRLPPMALEDADLAQLVTALDEGAGQGAAAQELEEALS